MVRINKPTAIAGLLGPVVGAVPAFERASSNETAVPHDFLKVPATSDLEWTPCFGHFDCANLVVPLDYSDCELGNTTVAFIRQNAENANQDILFNPGGPGESGVQLILDGTGDKIMTVTGGAYNVVSFDPRGVNNSAIDLTCFPESTDIRDAYWTGFQSLSQSSGLDEQYARTIAVGQWCTEANENTTAKYSGTSAVVQDMIHFTELQAARRQVQKPKEARVNYYGVSYGTVIGHTLAALYPDRVGRMILDGNVNSENHYAGADLTAVENVDMAYEWFFHLCQAAGPDSCEFYADDVKQRFDNLLVKLEQTPAMFAHPNVDDRIQTPQIVIKAQVLATAFDIMYTPMTGFPALASGLAALEKGDAAGWMLATASFGSTDAATLEKYIMISAIDAAGRSAIQNLSDFHHAFDEVNATSIYAGRKYALEKPVISAALDFAPPESQLFSGFKKTNTSSPILFVNPSVDPITPISGARHMAQYFEGAVVLEQNSTGHSISGIRSACTRGYIAAYMANGTLPEVGTVCQASEMPFFDKP